MGWNGLLLWGGAAVLGAALAWIAWRAWDVQRARQRARSFRPPAARELRWDTGPARPAAPPPGIPPSLADHVRRDAEEAARRAAVEGTGMPPNPYPAGTPEYVIWVASFHLAMTQFEPTLPPAPAAPPASPGVSPP